MFQPQPTPDHGTRGRYQRGCKCDQCKKAQSDYRKELRQRKIAHQRRDAGQPIRVPKTEVSDAQLIAMRPLPTPPPPLPEGDGPVTAAVKAELEMLNAAVDRPGQVATAIRLAQVLDNDLAISSHASAANRLQQILTALGTGGRTRKGKLAEVRKLSG